MRRRGGRKRALGTRAPMTLPQGPNQRWSLDFVSDAFACGRRFRILCVVDDFTRECLALVPDTSLSGARVARELDGIVAIRGKPLAVVSDNGTELASVSILRWSQERRVEWHYIAPGKPTQNAFVESFNGRLRDEPERDAVHLNGADASRARCLATGLQHGQAALETGRAHPRRDRRATGLRACPQPRCHHLNHQPSTQRTLRLSGYNQGSTSAFAKNFPATLASIARKQGIGIDAVEVWFQNEARVGQRNGITRRWARRGTRQCAPQDQRCASAYIFVIVCPQEGRKKEKAGLWSCRSATQPR